MLSPFNINSYRNIFSKLPKSNSETVTEQNVGFLKKHRGALVPPGGAGSKVAFKALTFTFELLCSVPVCSSSVSSMCFLTDLLMCHGCTVFPVHF